MSYNDIDARFVPIVAWPGERTKTRKSGRFKATWSQTLTLLWRELRYLSAKNLVLQIDMDAAHIRNDGYPKVNARARGPGVILTFDSRFGPLSYPCDTFKDWETNLRAIALGLEALRKVDRYGVTRRGEQYTGWKQLGSGRADMAMTKEQAARILATYISQSDVSHADALSILRNVNTYREWYRSAAFDLHPDRPNGNTESFQRLQEAKRVLDAHHGIQ